MKIPFEMPRTAIVLSGGAGERLRPITRDIPKGLVQIGGKPILQWVLEWLKSNGVLNVIIGVAYLGDKIKARVKDGHEVGVTVTYSVHTVDGGTGEGFRLAVSRYVDEETFFALNGDQITDLRLRSMLRTHLRGEALATVGVVHPKLPFGLVTTDKKGYCNGFLEKPIMKDLTCSTGIYVFQHDILPYLPKKGDIEKTTLPILTKKKRLRVHVHNGSFLTINTVKELEEADRVVRESRDK